jgi:acetylornithine/succinyldiaminopimelate/putrescine aminotransferase
MHDPVLGHITTFGGHPVSCAAGKTAFEVLLEGNYISQIKHKEEILLGNIRHPSIKSTRTAGLWASLEFSSFETNKKIIDRCIEKGLITDWFLFAPQSMRVAPPLIITEEELLEACRLITEAVEEAMGPWG